MNSIFLNEITNKLTMKLVKLVLEYLFYMLCTIDAI
jgi:hypothetical protein